MLHPTDSKLSNLYKLCFRKLQQWLTYYCQFNSILHKPKMYYLPLAQSSQTCTNCISGNLLHQWQIWFIITQIQNVLLSRGSKLSNFVARNLLQHWLTSYWQFNLILHKRKMCYFPGDQNSQTCTIYVSGNFLQQWLTYNRQFNSILHKPKMCYLPWARSSQTCKNCVPGNLLQEWLTYLLLSV